MKITDVAKEAGVSITTVSRALNGNYPVKEETRRKIEAAVAKLGYRPNAMARSMITGRSMTIGVLAPGLTNLYFPALIEAIEKITEKQNYQLTISNTGGLAEKERHACEDYFARQVDGIIALNPSEENLRNNFFFDMEKKVPLLIANGDRASYGGNHICYYEETGMQKAMERLIELGHEKIALIRGANSVSFTLRERIYREILEAKGLEYIRILMVQNSNSQEAVEETREGVLQLFEDPDRPTAIFACNDLMALSVLNTCAERGVPVPEDISIIGFDNSIFSLGAYPPLSSVDLKIKEVGSLVAKGILSLMENPDHSVKFGVETEYIERKSCGPPEKKSGPEKLKEDVKGHEV